MNPDRPEPEEHWQCRQFDGQPSAHACPECGLRCERQDQPCNCCNVTITVCDNCMRASCWQGEFMCDEAYDSGTIDIPLRELKKMALEDSRYWRIRNQIKL